MNSHPEWQKWLESYPKFNWKGQFDCLISQESKKAVEFSDYGIACLVKGLQAEFIDEDYTQAFNWYENGASQFEPLCLFRLHEIYLGDSQFKIEYDEKQTLAHLIYCALLSQFENFDDKISFWQKFEGFWKKEPAKTAYFQELLINPVTYYFASTGNFFSKLFSFYTTKNNFIDVLPELKALPYDTLKTKFFSILNGTFDFLSYSYSSGYSKVELEHFVEEVLEMLTSDIYFDNFFHNYLTHIKLLRVQKKFGTVFQRRLETDCFWVWSLSFLTSMKNHYLGLLLQYEDIFTDGSLVLKWKNTSSWVSNFIGFCHEKGIGARKDETKALEFYERDIQDMPRVLFSRYRKILILKSQDGGNEQQPGQEGNYIRDEIEDLKSKLEERFEDAVRMDCYLYYVYGKLYEKIEMSIDEAIQWYEKGVNSDTDSCQKNHLICNESWRMKCRRRLQKLQKKKGMNIFFVNKNQED